MIAYTDISARCVSTGCRFIFMQSEKIGSRYITYTAMPEVEEKIISLRVFMPESLRNEFKAVCARQGRNMSEVINDFVLDYVARIQNPNQGKPNDRDPPSDRTPPPPSNGEASQPEPPKQGQRQMTKRGKGKEG